MKFSKLCIHYRKMQKIEKSCNNFWHAFGAANFTSSVFFVAKMLCLHKNFAKKVLEILTINFVERRNSDENMKFNTNDKDTAILP